MRFNDIARGCCVWVARLAVVLMGGLAPSMPLAGAQTAPIFPLTETHRVDTWSMDEVVPGRALRDVVQTPDGYLWLGSYEGVLRFDGQRFERFSPKDTPQLPSSIVLCLFVDREGALWVGTDVGPARLRNGVWEDLRARPGRPGERVICFAQNAAGDVFVGTTSRLLRYRAERFEEVPIPTARAHVSVTVDNQDRLWMGTLDTLSVWENAGWRTVFTRREEEPGLGVIISSAKGGVWVPDGEQVRLWRGEKWETRFAFPERFRSDVATLCEDREGRLWAGLFVRGVVCFFPDGRIGYATVEEGLLNNATPGLRVDREGNLWVPSNGGGLARLKPRRVESFGLREGLRQGVVNSAVELDPGRLLVATHGGGALEFDGRGFGKPWLTANGALRRDNWVLSVCRRANGDVWLSVFLEGLAVLEHGRTNITLPWVQGDPEIDVLFEDSQRRLWLGTRKGLGILRENRVRLLTESPPAGHVRAIAEGAAGQIWASVAEQGLFVSSGAGDVPVFRRFEHGPADPPWTLFRDASGVLWAGYEAGRIARIQPERATVYGPEHGLPEAGFASLVADDDHNLWAGSDLGLVRIGRASLEAVGLGRSNRLDCSLYDPSDGMLGRQCRRGYQPLAGRMADGRLWFATLQGLATVDPKSHTGRPVPVPWIEEIAFGDRVVRLPTQAHQEITVPSGTVRLKIRFTAIHMEAPERLVFEYQIRPSDTRWIALDKTRSVELRDLRPGRRQFLVRAAHDCSHWSEPASLTLVVQPRLWETAAFKGAAILAGFGAGALIVVRVMRRRAENALARQRRQFAEERAQELEKTNAVLRERQVELEEAMARVKTLTGLIPICSNCHSIRDDQGYWKRVEVYIQDHSDAKFSHGLCPKCVRTLFPEAADELKI